MMIYAYGFSGSFGSRVKYKSIGHNIYTGRRSNSRSKPTPIHETVQKYYLNYSYSRTQFSRLPQAVTKNKIYLLFQKVSYASKIIDPVIIGFIPNDVSNHLHIFDNLIVKFGIREKYIGLSKIYNVDSLDRFRISIVDKVKTDICNLQKGYHSKENNMKIKYANNLVQKLVMGDPTTCVYKLIYN